MRLAVLLSLAVPNDVVVADSDETAIIVGDVENESDELIPAVQVGCSRSAGGRYRERISKKDS